MLLLVNYRWICCEETNKRMLYTQFSTLLFFLFFCGLKSEKPNSTQNTCMKGMFLLQEITKCLWGGNLSSFENSSIIICQYLF